MGLAKYVHMYLCQDSAVDQHHMAPANTMTVTVKQSGRVRCVQSRAAHAEISTSSLSLFSFSANFLEF